jgi:Domain of unknown function (DUF4878)
VRSRSALAALALSLLPLAACGGGGGSDDAEKVAREFTEAISQSDSEKLCNDILSKEAREKVSGATGDKAEEQCEKQLSSFRGRPIEIKRIVSTKVDGDKATVIAEIEESRSRRRQVFELMKEDGDFRIASFGQ